MTLKKVAQSITDLRGPIIFRPQRGGLEEAMTEAQEFSNIRAMKEFIVKDWNEGWKGEGDLFTAEDIVIDEENAVNDNRIGWEDTMLVCIKRLGKDVYSIPQCIGMCATIYPHKK